MLEMRVRRLMEILDSFPGVLVAYSGGVDSACLLRAARERLGARATGVLADSPSLPRDELAAALRLAEAMGAPVEVVRTAEMEDPRYTANPVDRCYFCKHELFTRMERLAGDRGCSVLAYGENADDAVRDRPGSRAAVKFQVRAPLKEAGLTKRDVRDLAARWGLAVADKPSSPCLSSRIPHGTPVTVAALAMIEAGERAIRALGFRVFRLRHHGTRGRIEFAPEELPRALAEPMRGRVREVVLHAGYEEVEIDPKGYPSHPTTTA